MESVDLGTVGIQQGRVSIYLQKEFLYPREIELFVRSSELGRHLVQAMQKVAFCLRQLSLWDHVILRIEIVQIAKSESSCVTKLHRDTAESTSSEAWHIC